MKLISAAISVLILFPILAFAEESKLEVGILVPLSGELAGMGTAVSRGIDLAVEKYPENFKNVKFILEDTRYDANATLSSYQKLKAQKNNKAIYIWGSPTCMPLVPIAEKEERILICFSGDPKPGLKYVLSFNNPAADYAEVMTKYLRSLGSSSIAIVYSEIQFYESLADSLEEQLKSIASPYRNSVLPSTIDFATIITKLKSEKSEALALFLLPHQISIFAKHMAILNYRPSVVGADTFSDSEAIKKSNEIFEKAVYVDMAVSPDFTSAYLKKFGNTANLTFAYNGYHFALLMANLLNDESQEITNEELLGKLKQYQIADANISFKENSSFGQYFSFPIELKKVHPLN